MADVEFSHGMGAYGRDSVQQAPQQVATTNSLTFMTNLAGAAVSLALIAGVGVWGYKLLVRDVSGVPVVRAIEGEMRIRPDEPGGQLARHQGLAVNAIAADGVAGGPVDQVTLAPRSSELAAEDQPVAVPAVIQPARLPSATQAFDAPQETQPVAEPPKSELATLLEQGEIDAVVAELTAGVEPMVAVPGAKTVKAVTAQPETSLEVAATIAEADSTELQPTPVALDTSGLRRSIRPRLRPEDISGMLQTASYSPAPATQEIDPGKIPPGTRLAQLGAFDSADVARTEWTRLKGGFGEYLDGKSRVIEQAQSGGRTFYRLRAMGFVDLGDARRFCSAFKAEGVDCIPVLSK